MAPQTDETQRLVDELLTWERTLDPLRELWKLLWAAWTITPGTVDPTNPYLSQVRIPYGFHAVETILPRILGQDPRLAYRALDDDRDAPAAALMGGLTSWQMELMAWENEARTFGRQALVTGYTVAKVGWTQRWQRQKFTEKQQHYDHELGAHFDTEAEVEDDVLVRNQPFMETVALEDFVFPLTARTIPDASAVWQRRWVTLEYLRRHKDVYRDTDKVRGEDFARLRESRIGQFDPQNLQLSSWRNVESDADGAIVELWERWTDDRLVAVASPHTNPVKLRDEPNPFWHGRKPYVDWAPIPRPFQLPGVGVIAPIYDLTEDLNTMRRQRRDAVTILLNPMWKAIGGFNTDNVVMEPGAVVELGEMEDLQPLILPPSDFGSSINEEQQVIRDIQNLSGAFQYLSGDTGMSTAAGNTATGVATITAEGNKRIAEMVKTLNERTMIPFGRILASMNAQFLEENVAVDFSKSPEAAQAWQEFRRAMTPPGVEPEAGQPAGLVRVDPDWLHTHGRLEPLPEIGADRAMNDVQKRSDAVQVVQALAPFLAVPTPLVNMRALISYVLEQFGVPKDQRDQIMDQAQAQAQMPPPPPPSGSGPSGPSGDNAPTGAVGGTPGANGAGSLSAVLGQ